MTDASNAVPCGLSEPDRDRRARAWAGLRPSVLDRARKTDGFEVSFELAALERVERLADAERCCCGWATWSVEVHPDRAVLHVTGPPAPVGALAGAFGV